MKIWIYSWIQKLKNEFVSKVIQIRPILLIVSTLQYERIDLWFELFFVKEIRRIIEWLQEIKTVEQWGTTLLYIYSNTAK
jgi:hypothetical protein